MFITSTVVCALIRNKPLWPFLRAYLALVCGDVKSAFRKSIDYIHTQEGCESQEVPPAYLKTIWAPMRLVSHLLST